MGDLKYLSSLGLDGKDAQLAKEKGHIENRIAHYDVKLTTAKFLRDKVHHTFICLCYFIRISYFKYRKKYMYFLVYN